MSPRGRRRAVFEWSGSFGYPTQIALVCHERRTDEGFPTAARHTRRICDTGRYFEATRDSIAGVGIDVSL